VLTYLEHTIFGQVNLNHQLLIALAMLLGLAIVITSFSRENDKPILILLTALLLFSPEAGATWVGGTIPYYALMLFGLLSIKTLFHIEQPRYLIISILSMWLAAYSMIGGVLLPVIGIVYLIVSGKIKRLEGVIWTLASVATLIGYFKGFRRHENQASVFNFVEDPGFAYEFTLRVLGNFLHDFVELNLLSNLTLIMLASFAYLVFVKTSFRRLFLSVEGLSFIFVLMILASVVVGRVSFNDPAIAYADRYFVFTKTLWLLALAYLLNTQFVSQEVKSFLLGFTALYMLSAYQFETTNLKIHKQSLNAAMLEHLVRQESSGFEFGHRPSEAARIVDHAINLGVYSPELIVTQSRPLKYLKYTDFIDGLNISVIRDQTLGRYRYFTFSVDNSTNIHEIAIVPRDVFGPASLLKPAAIVDVSRHTGVDLSAAGATLYEVIIDTQDYDEALTHDVFVISLGMITTMGTF